MPKSLRQAAENPDTASFHQKISVAEPEEINHSLEKKYSDKRNTLFMLAAHHHTSEAMQLIAKKASQKAIDTALSSQNKNGQTGLGILTLHQSGQTFRSVVKKASYKTITELLTQIAASVSGKQDDTHFMLAAKHQNSIGFRAIIGKSPLLVQKLYPTIKSGLLANSKKNAILKDIDFVLHTHNSAAKYPKDFLSFMLETFPNNPKKIHEHEEWKKILDTALKVIPDNNDNKPLRDQLQAMSCRVYISALNKGLTLDDPGKYKKNILSVTPENISARDNFLIATLLDQRQEIYNLRASPTPKQKIQYQVKMLQHLCHSASQGSEDATTYLREHKGKMEELVSAHKDLIRVHIETKTLSYATLFSHTHHASNSAICRNIIQTTGIDQTLLERALSQTSAAHITGDEKLSKILTTMKKDVDGILSLKSSTPMLRSEEEKSANDYRSLGLNSR
jgi:hypothetical protein